MPACLSNPTLGFRTFPAPRTQAARVLPHVCLMMPTPHCITALVISTTWRRWLLRFWSFRRFPGVFQSQGRCAGWPEVRKCSCHVQFPVAIPASRTMATAGRSTTTRKPIPSMATDQATRESSAQEIPLSQNQLRLDHIATRKATWPYQIASF